MKLKITEEQLAQLKELVSINENAFADSEEELNRHKVDSNLSLMMLFKDLYHTMESVGEIEKMLMGDEKNTDRLKKSEKYIFAAMKNIDAILQTRGVEDIDDKLKLGLEPLDWKDTPFSKNE